MSAARTCNDCLVDILCDNAELIGVRGQPGVRSRVEPFPGELARTTLPSALGRVVELAPIAGSREPLWVVLNEDGVLLRFHAATGECARLATCPVLEEPRTDSRSRREPRRRLHVSANGDFAAVVNDFGERGQVIELRTGAVTMQLSAPDRYASTVSFSLAFAVAPNGETVVIHRTSRCRLDVSDPATGHLLTEREIGLPSVDGPRPAHYLDYFQPRAAAHPG